MSDELCRSVQATSMTSPFILCIPNLINQKYEGAVETGIVCKVGDVLANYIYWMVWLDEILPIMSTFNMNS